jgi:predicted nucleotidyltransferase
MIYGLKQQTIDAIINCLAATSSIEEAILFGSRAKGNYKTGSDIDLTLKGKELTLSEVFQLENQLDDLLLPYKFDISIFQQIDNPDLLDHIQRVGIAFYKRPLPSAGQ